MKWTKRKNGQVMGTFRVRVHVPKEMVDFLQTECEDMTQKATLEWIRQRWRDIMPSTFDSLMVVDGEPVVVKEDDAEESIRDGYVPYEGPDIIIST